MHRQGTTFTVDVPALGLVVVDLPVPFGHEVLAGKDRLAIEYADAPVVFGVEELLCQQQHRVFEQLGGGFKQRLLALDLDHAPGETTVGDFQYQRKPKAFAHPFEIFRSLLVENFGGGHAQVMALEQVGQVDLVGAAQNRRRIIHHHQPFALGFLGETVGVVIDAGGFADQQAIVFGNPRVILALDQFDIDAQRPADPDEIIQRLGIGRRQGFLRIVQDGQVVTGQSAGSRHAPDLATEVVEGMGELIFLIFAQLMQRTRLYAFDVPAVSSSKFN
ncbi:hypothetical protein D3C87_1270710 [compost metagenome]